ncbi:MAG: PepSY-associated TM helix domain-containing protein [Halioglobus sp.]
MTFKRTIFWTHLAVGVVTGLVVLFLSVTGILLTYERQIVDALEHDGASSGDPVLSADQLADRASEITGGKATGVVFLPDAQSPVTVKIGRRQAGLLDPYTGEELEGASVTREFFHTVTALHRWLALEGAGREAAAAAIGAANLAFLFMVISGVYLWLPKRWNWRVLKMNSWFKGNYPNNKARDYNWHHVIGIWCFVPLFFVICTAVVFSYSWANTMVYSFYGEEAPTRGGPRGTQAQKTDNVKPTFNGGLDLQALLVKAKTHDNNWQRITLLIPKENSSAVSFTVDTGTGGQPQKQTTITLNRKLGELVNQNSFGDRSAGQQTRVIIRFLHTGEVLGLFGQTLAGLASLGACFLVYTGLMLAYRRLLAPVLARR